MNPYTPSAPRNFTTASPVPGLWPGAGLPNDRAARIAARRAFVEVKQAFLDAVAALDDDDAAACWLKHQVRQSSQPEDLWLLRSAVFAALRQDPERGPAIRQALRKSLDSMFPGTFFMSGFATL